MMSRHPLAPALVLIAASVGCAARNTAPALPDALVVRSPAGMVALPYTRFLAVVSRLSVDDTLRVVTFDGASGVGEFRGASEAGLVLAVRGTSRGWACTDIARIDRVRPRAALGGALIAGLLAIVPAWNACGDEVLTCWVPGMAVYGGLGALAGTGWAGGGPIYHGEPGSCGPSAPPGYARTHDDPLGGVARPLRRH